MKKSAFIAISTAVLLISAFFMQTAAAQSGNTSKTKPVICKVKKNNAGFFVSATEKTVKLKKGTALKWAIFDLHQGLIVVEAKIGKKWTRGEILLDDTTCN
jgi:ABC-type sugar transport system substrate-binding protein